MSWRPEDWKNPQFLDSDFIYEAGADAMLEALRKLPTSGHTDGTTRVYTISNYKGGPGTFVFIPDDEPEKKPIYTLLCQDCGMPYESEVGFPDVQICDDCFMRGSKMYLHPASQVIEKGYFCSVCGNKEVGEQTPCHCNLFSDRGIRY